MIKNIIIYVKNKKNNFLLLLKRIKIFKGVVCIILIRLFLNSFSLISSNQNYFKEYNDLQLLYTNKTINEYFLFSKFKKMLPGLNNNFSITPKNINEIFNARQLYISDVRITPDYIRYIRPIGGGKGKKRHINYYKNKTLIDTNMLKKRPDQYDYKTFCEIALKEELIDINKIEYNNSPIISIVLPSYNKQNILLKSVRSIQNQNFKNIEIIIVNDCSNDNSSKIFEYLLETDERIRIFHHMKNLGLYRSRLDGILYSRGKYIIGFDTGDLYEDNYVLLDSYNIMERYKLDSCKFFFRMIHNFNNLSDFIIPYMNGIKSKIEYNKKNIKSFDNEIFKQCGNIWNRIIRADIYIKSLFLLNELMLNVYKNFWEDIWYNNIVNMASNNYAIINRVGYVYYFDGKGVGTPKFETKEQNNSMIREYVSFLYFDYNFCSNSLCKSNIIKKLREYNEKSSKIQIKYFLSHFETLNSLLETLIKDPEIKFHDKEFCKKLLYESIIREKQVNRMKK